MNRDQIKFLAIITMTCNHIANIFLTPGTLLFEVMIDIGYFTAITMCYFLVEGYGYTHDKKKYGERWPAVRCDIIHTILSGIWHGPDEYAVYLIFVFPDS